MNLRACVTCASAAFAALALGPAAAHAGSLAAGPDYGAYVSGAVGPLTVAPTGTIKNGVLPSIYGAAPVISASGLAGSFDNQIYAFANSSDADLVISARTSAGFQASVLALFFTKVTFSGNGTAHLIADGTFSHSDPIPGSGFVTSGDLYFSISQSAPALPFAAYDQVLESNWSRSLTFDFTNGETVYVVGQLYGATANGGSLSLADPLSLTVPQGTGFTAAAPNFLVGGAVPEPASWALMLTGFGFAGLAMRRRASPDLA